MPGFQPGGLGSTPSRCSISKNSPHVEKHPLEKSVLGGAVGAAAVLVLTVVFAPVVAIWLARDAYWSLVKDQYRALRASEK